MRRSCLGLQDAEVPEQQASPQQPLQDEDDELAGLGLGEDADEGAEPAPAGDEEPDAEDAQAEGSGDEQLEREESPQADEAEEERPSAKKRTEEQEQREMQEDVRALVGRMEQAVDEDAADVLKGAPALRKLKMLSQARPSPRRML